jgi:Skp family chaperone for outer membrane proteins
MSRSVWVVAGLALVLAIGALILPFALPGGGGVDEAAFRALENRVNELQIQGSGLRVAALDAEEAFIVFLNAVEDLRQRAKEKQEEIVELQQEFVASTISKDEYEQRVSELQAELLDAQLTIDIGTIDRMVESNDFADMRSDLELLREQAQPMIDEMKNLVSAAKMGVIDPEEYQSRYTQLKNAFTQFDQVLTQYATAKIVQVAERIAVQQGYDLVLRAENVIVYHNPATLVDITESVKSEISDYL